MNDDEMMNNILATGGLFAGLHLSVPQLRPEVIYDDNGQATNKIRVHLHYMKSPYILTVERDTSEDESS